MEDDDVGAYQSGHKSYPRRLNKRASCTGGADPAPTINDSRRPDRASSSGTCSLVFTYPSSIEFQRTRTKLKSQVAGFGSLVKLPGSSVEAGSSMRIDCYQLIMPNAFGQKLSFGRNITQRYTWLDFITDMRNF